MVNLLAGSNAMIFFMILSLVIVAGIAATIVSIISVSLRRAAKRHAHAPNIPVANAAPDNAQGNAGGGPTGAEGNTGDNNSNDNNALSQYQDNSPSGGNDQEPPEDDRKQTSWWRKFYNNILKRLGLYDSGQMSLGFNKALETIASYVSAGDFKYQLPWYMMLGANSSGKSSIIEHMGVELPIGKVDFGDDPACNWWFYDQAVLLDVRGDLFIGNDGFNTNENAWNNLLSLLIKHRTSRPIDGIVLTISADDLQKPKEELMRISSSIYRKLSNMQKRLSIKVPIYIVISKMDLISGFSRFAQRLPKDKHNNMFGWSVPYPPERPYKKQWKDEMCNTLDSMIEDLQAQIYATSKDASSNDGTILLFKHEMKQFYNNIGDFLDYIFKDSHYNETYFLRGVYFCGLSQNEDEKNAVQVPIFTRDLFQQKIFRELNLAQPILQLLKDNRRNLNMAKIGVFSICATWGAGIIYDNREMERYRIDMEPFIYHVERSLHTINKYKGYNYNNKEYQEFLSTSTENLIHKMAKIQDSTTGSWFLPSSWFSNIDYYVGKSITFAYNDIILQGLHINLLKKVDEVVNIKYDQSAIPKPNITQYLEYNIDAYRKTFNYVVRLIELELYINRYNNMEDSHALDDITVLLKYMYDIDLPKSFFAAAKLYHGVLRRLTDKNINIFIHRENATRRLLVGYKDYLTTVFLAKNSLKSLDKLRLQFKQLNDQALKNVTKKDLEDLLSASNNVMTQLSSRELLWLQNKEFRPDDSFGKFMTNVASSKLIGMDVANEVMVITAQKFGEFKKSLTGFTTPITKQLYKMDETTKHIVPSVGLKESVQHIEKFLSASFFNHVSDKNDDIRQIPPGKILIWDINELKNANKFMAQYSEYINNDIAQVPLQLRRIFEKITRDSLQKIIVSSIAKAQKFQDDPTQYKGFAKNEMLINQVDNIKAALVELNQIYKLIDSQMRNSNFLKLKTLIIDQCESLLQQIDNQLINTNLYNYYLDGIDNWTGQKPLSFYIFNVVEKQDLTVYLNSQREGILQLARIASPVIAYLNTPDIKQFVDSMLIGKWQNIIEQLTMYKQNKHNNSLKGMEIYIQSKLNNITLTNCPTRILTKNSDFFQTRYNNMINKISRRCNGLLSMATKAKYDHLAEFFNQNISGKYPFVDKSVSSHSIEKASEEDIETLYKLRAAISLTELKKMHQDSKKSPAQAQAFQFVRSLDKLSHVVLKADEHSTIPGANATIAKGRYFDVVFRPNRAQEVGSEAIVDQVFSTGSHEINWRSPKKYGRIMPEESLKLTVRWAASSGIKPRPDPKQPHMQVSGNMVRFNFEEYGFASLIKNHKWAIEADNSILLRFKIPIANTLSTDPNAEAKVKMSSFLLKIRIYEKDKTGRYIGPMPVDSKFPIVAPSFGIDVPGTKDAQKEDEDMP